MSLKQKAVTSVKWASIAQFGRQSMQLITTMVLARLLDPSDFGLMGMAVVVTGFATLFSDLGTAAAIVQRRDISEEFLSSIFWVNVSFGVLTTAVFFVFAPLVATFYQEQRVANVLYVLSITFFITSLGIVQKAILQRNLSFHTLAIVDIVAVVLGAIIGIGLGFRGAGVWSLVYRSLAIAFVTTIMLWGFTTWKPTAVFHWNETISVFHYSMNLTGANILNYFTRNADYLLIGRFLGAKELGYYTLAYQVMLYPLQNITYVVANVMFPSFAQIQDDHDRFRRAYLKVAGAIALIVFPMMLGLMILAEPFVFAVFGIQWTPTIALLVVLAPVGMVQSIGATLGTIYQSKGRTEVMFRWGLIRGFLIISSFIVGLQWGVLGVATAYAVITIILLYPNFVIAFRLIDLPVYDLGKVLWRPFVSSLLMVVAVLSLTLVLPPNLVQICVLAIAVPMGCVIYALASWYINQEQLLEVISMTGLVSWKFGTAKKS